MASISATNGFGAYLSRAGAVIGCNMLRTRKLERFQRQARLITN
jgi:hypothetical protein